MTANEFIERVNNGERVFDNTIVDGMVDPDLIKLGAEEIVSVACIRVTHYDSKRHVQFVAPVFLVQEISKIPL